MKKITFLVVLLMLVSILSLSMGTVNLFSQAEDVFWLILMDVRLPRLVLGFLVGASLGMSGAVLQGFFRNPLAEAGVLGVSSGGALFAVLSLVLGVANQFIFALPLAGILGAGVTATLLHVLVRKNINTLTVILAGVAINSFASACISLILNLSSNPYALLEVFFWLLGSLASRSWDHVFLCFPFVAVGAFFLMRTRKALDALSLGEEVAHSLGFPIHKTYVQMLLGVACAIGASVAVSGIIGFIGLVVPHLLRPFFGERPKHLLIPSALGGAILLIVADTLGRFLAPQGELKLGVITAFLGAPFFFLVLLRRRRLSL